MNTVEIKKVLKEQKEYFDSGKTLPVEERIIALESLKNCIIKNEALISDALFKDFRRPGFEAYATEIGSILEEINKAIKEIKSWVVPVKISTPPVLFSSKSEIIHNPYGLVLIMGAWNYPFALSLVPLVGAIAAGNCVIVKPSEVSSNSSKVIARIIKESFDQKHIRAIEGGVEIATKLLSQRFDYIFFTGGTTVGKIVAKAAAKNLTPCTLELGGKSPCVVNDASNLALVAKRIVWGKFINAGQTCIAPDYILVKKDLKEDLITNLQNTITTFYGANPEESYDYCRIVNKNHFDRLTLLMKSGKVVFGGKTDKKHLYISPTLITEVTWKDKIMKEEIFGPILPIITYDNIDQVITKMKKQEKPLAIYLFTEDPYLQTRIKNETSSGGLCINATILHTTNMELPFGGVGNSGIGKYHGYFSFQTFSHQKAVMSKSFWPDLDISYPPYKEKLFLLKKIWGNGLFK
jgi:acyl-CoA reductase-like NAD-dependent aldehyde dehydrogenase